VSQTMSRSLIQRSAREAMPMGIGLLLGLLVYGCESDSTSIPPRNSGGLAGARAGSGAAGGGSGGGSQSIGGVSGTSGAPATSGASGVSGGTAGKMSGSAGMAGATGGSGPEGGSGGDGGAPAEGGAGGGDDGTETLGDACDSPAELACAGHHQRVTLICGADRRWEVNQTCGGDQVCDSSPGIRRGTCQDRLAECRDFDPGYRFCQDSATVAECGPDNVTLSVAETCTGACREGACDNRPNHCPREPFFNCSDDCGDKWETCRECSGLEAVFLPDTEHIVRIPEYAAACPHACSDAIRIFGIAQAIDGELPAVRVRVSSPWKIVQFQSGDSPCELPAVTECAIYDSFYGAIFIITDDPSAKAENVTLTFRGAVAQGLACP
jgi:hypothetical protein